MLVGLVLVTTAMFWLSTGPGLSPKAEGPNTCPVPSSTGGARSNRPPQENTDTPNNFSTNSLTAQSAEDTLDSAIYEQTEKIKTQKFHIVRKGETLSEISYKYYGSANKWQKILEANRDEIEDVSKLKPGTKLIIPE